MVRDSDVPYYVKIWLKLTNPFRNADFQSVFACSALAVTASKREAQKRSV